MKKYRIREYKDGFRKEYYIERKSFFGFWVTMCNIYDMWATFETLEDAEKFKQKLLTPRKNSIISI